MASSFWPALIGFALGSTQVLFVDWIRSRSQNRRLLRLLRAELRRLSAFRTHWGWRQGVVPPNDATPVPPRITPSYQRLLQEIDFWLTDEHSDDNTQQALIEIADGTTVLGRYDADVRKLLDSAKAARTHSDKTEFLSRSVDTSQVYDKELDRWLVMVESALPDLQRRLRSAGTWRQIGRALSRMPRGTNPPVLPPLDHSSSNR